MEGRQRRSFTDDYKRQAVDLVASSGRSIGSVAKELGLRDSVLRRWVELRGAGREPTAAARRHTWGTRCRYIHVYKTYFESFFAILPSYQTGPAVGDSKFPLL